MSTNTFWRLGPALGFILSIGLPARLAAQTVYYACYVPGSGTVYRIKEPGLPTQCGSSKKNGTTIQHVEFSWQSGTDDHGALTGLTDDDHPQYLLSSGARSSTNGFAVTGTIGSGTIPATGTGARMMWYPGKAAFRAGDVTTSYWDDANIGVRSIGLGFNAMASGVASLALGPGTSAAGQGSVAISGGWATGDHAMALGTSSASGTGAIVLGMNSAASGNYSVALGSDASTNGKAGAFVYGDHSVLCCTNPVMAIADNQFVARAQQFWLGTNNSVTATAGRFLETSTGAYLSSGGTWTNSSDVNRKTAFEDVDADEVLAKVAAMPIRTWSYKSEDASVRHIGPTAQDFSVAFHLGDTDKAIATVDADGVSLAAVQALERRSVAAQREIEALRAQLRALAERVQRLERDR